MRSSLLASVLPPAKAKGADAKRANRDTAYPGDISPEWQAKASAQNLDELERLEGPLVRLRQIQIDAGLGPAGQFDAEHLKALHHFLFQDVFEWAGHTRNEGVRLSDGTIATEPTMQKLGGSLFLPGAQIPAALDQVADYIRAADYLRGLPQEMFCEPRGRCYE